MSYILDALTKSQQQRRAGDVPTLSTSQLPLYPAKAARTRYVNIALILLAGAAVLFALQILIRQDDKLNLPPQAAANAPTAAAPKAPAVSPGRESSPAPTRPASVTPGTRLIAETSSASPPESAARPAERVTDAAPGVPSSPPRRSTRGDFALTDAPIASPPRLAAPADNPLHLTVSSAPAATSQPEAAPPPPMSREDAAMQKIEDRLFPGAREAVHPETLRLAKELREMASRPVAPPAASEVVSDEPAHSEVIPLAASPPAGAPMASSSPPRETPVTTALLPAVAGDEVMPGAPGADAVGYVLPNVRALPNDVQASLGRLTINAHVYDDAPAERMVIINMNRYREGETLREGPRVDAITVKGAVLSYQSHRFHLNAR